VPSNLWYRNAVIYSLSVETFMDGNGDGVGDFVGLRRRLDYLESLGIDVIWLAPSQPTPNRDDGYDVADYYGIDPRFGSSGDFADFMADAEGRGIRVILDLVVNHTSDRHPWFLDARRRGDSPYRDWYVWSKKRPRNAGSGVVFPGVQKTTWTYAQDVREWYFHRFFDFEPDLNTDNPRVREEIHRIIGYWLRLGVAGFRVDAVPFMLEKPLRGRSPGAPHFEYLRELRDVLQWHRGDAILLGEANIVPRDDDEYFADGEGLHAIFNFWVNQHVFLALATGDARPVAAALRETANIPSSGVWAYFLRNHDELDLGRLTDAQRAEVFAGFARDGLDAALRPRHSATAGADARRTRQDRARIQPHVVAARRTRPALRRGNRDGREPAPERAGCDPDADAMVGGGERRILDRTPWRAVCTRDRRRRVQLPDSECGQSRQEPVVVAELDARHHPDSEAGQGVRSRRVHDH